MLIFLAIMAAGFILLLGGMIFGHDHDFGHDLGGHDVDSDSDHDHDSDNQGIVSIFSTKVIGTFVMGFGGGGGLVSYQYPNWDWLQRSGAGLVVGVLMAALMYFVLRVMYGHQANSIIYPSQLIDKSGVVTIPIEPEALGEVNVYLGEETVTRMARASNGGAIPRGRTVKVIASEGSQLLVEETNR